MRLTRRNRSPSKLTNLSKLGYKLARVVLILVLPVLVIKANKIFQIATIECLTMYGACSQELSDRLEPLYKTKIYLLTSDKTSSLISPHKLLSLKRKFPNGVTVEVDTPKAVATLEIKNPLSSQSQSFLVSQKGFILSETGNELLPVVVAESETFPLVGELVSDYASLQAVFLAFELTKLGLNTPHIIVNRDFLEIKNLSNAQIITSKEKNPQEVASSLQQILTTAKIEGKSPSKIDLRFIRPVLVY